MLAASDRRVEEQATIMKYTVQRVPEPYVMIQRDARPGRLDGPSLYTTHVTCQSAKKKKRLTNPLAVYI